jgi:hypothetical protein
MPSGDVPEWLWSGLQNRLPRFNSGRRLQLLEKNGLQLGSQRVVQSIPPFFPHLSSPASGTDSETFLRAEKGSRKTISLDPHPAGFKGYL